MLLGNEETRSAGGITANMTVKEFSIKDGNAGHIMALLGSTIYKDKPRAVCREYMTNGGDAHIMAGTPNRPILVTLPTSDNLQISIRDFGLGLTPTQVDDLFISYGASSKREAANAKEAEMANKQNGCLGIGCKCFRAYTDSMTLISIHDGIKDIYTIQINAAMKAICIPLSSSPTDEEHGVEVIVPVKPLDVNQFRRTAMNVAKYLTVPAIFADGSTPEAYNKTVEFPTWFLDSTISNPVAIMGGVAYPIEVGPMQGYDAELLSILSTRNLSLVIPMGELSFAASRESLEYNNRTSLALLRAAERVKMDVMNKITNELDTMPDIIAAIQFVQSMSATFPFARGLMKDLSYKGVKLYNNLPTEYKVEGDVWDIETKSPRMVTAFEVRNYTRRYEKMLTKDMGHVITNPKTCIFILDGATLPAQRAKTVSNLHGMTDFMVFEQSNPHFQKFADEYGFHLMPKNKVFYASHFERASSGSRVGGGGMSRKHIRLFTMDKSKYQQYRLRDVWHDVSPTAEFSDHKNYLYLPINNFSLKDACPPALWDKYRSYRRACHGFDTPEYAHDLNTVMVEIFGKDSVPTVYGVRSKDVSDLGPNWKPLKVAIMAKVRQMLNKIPKAARQLMADNFLESNDFVSLAEFLDGADMCKEVADVMSEVRALQKARSTYGVVVAIAKRAAEIVGENVTLAQTNGPTTNSKCEEILKKFPILRLVNGAIGTITKENDLKTVEFYLKNQLTSQP